jgi:NADPH2:quinone reductase
MLFIAGAAGGVGTFAVMLARASGVRRIAATAGSPASRRYLIEHCGLHESQIVDYRQPGFVEEAIARNGTRFDVVLDLVGGRMLPACCSLLGIDGDLASVVDGPDEKDFDALFDRIASFHLVGANAYSLSEDRHCWRKYRDLLHEFTAGFEGGTLTPPRIQVVGALSSTTVARAHERLAAGGVQGKLVMTC